MGAEHSLKRLDTRRPAWLYWGTRLLPVPQLTPLRISILYALFGFAALIVSDVLFVQYFSEPVLSWIQALKGGVEVLLTTGLIFVLTNRRETQLQQSLDRLDDQRIELDVLHRVLRHNLRNDLCVIKGYTQQIRDCVSSEQLYEACDAILATTEDMTLYTDAASRIDKLATGSENRVTCNLSEAIPQLLDAIPSGTDEVEITTNLSNEMHVEVNQMFEEAMKEVIVNAIEHNDSKRPTIEITVDPESAQSHLVEIRVVDNGPGLPSSEREPLEAGKEEPMLHISGLGLWFVKWTVDRSGGQVFFEDNESGGTTVRIQVPKAPEMLVN